MLNYIIFVVTSSKQNCKVIQSILTWAVLCCWKKVVLVKQPQYIQVNHEIIVNYGAIQKVCTP